MNIGVERVTSLAILTAMMLWPPQGRSQEAIRNGEPFPLRVTNVRSLEPEGRVGFSKNWLLYAVNGYGPHMSYILYCTNAAPQAGQTYTALDEYVSSDLSWLHLWPVEKKNIQLPPGTKKKKGRLYRVVIIQNMASEPKPDVACDLHSETAIQAKAAE